MSICHFFFLNFVPDLCTSTQVRRCGFQKVLFFLYGVNTGTTEFHKSCYDYSLATYRHNAIQFYQQISMCTLAGTFKIHDITACWCGNLKVA